MKACSQCGETKPEDEFYERKKGTGKRQAHCKACAGSRAMAWRLANRERFNDYQRAYAKERRDPKVHAERQADYRRRTYVPTARHGALAQRPHILYRVYDRDGELLYIGITVDIKTRLNHHRRKSRWGEVARVTREDHPDRASALAAETGAIRDENPTWNVKKRARPVS